MRRTWLATVLMLAVSSVAVGSAGAGSAGSAVSPPPKVVTRDLLVDGVTKTVVDSRTVALSVSDTSNLRGLQQLDVTWTGAHPTGGNYPDPNSVGAAGLEYPFVLLECRGIDDPAAPAAQQLSPQTCWTSSPRERYANDLAQGFPPWRLDLYAAPAERKAFVGGGPAGVIGGCGLYGGSAAEYWVPFIASNGHVYPGGPNGCAGQPPEAVQNTGDLTFPSNETFAVTSPDGRGNAKFVVHTSDQNASLGCSDTVACSLVAIPIMGMSCDVAGLGLPVEDRAPTSTVDPTDPTSPTVAALAEAACTTAGQLRPGVGGTGGNEAVAGTEWWAASNWRNRITVPLSFAPVGDACSTTGANGGVEIYGSELMTEATTQWNPHFCGNAQLFTLKHVQTGEPLARNLLAQNLQHLKTLEDTVPAGNVEAAFSSYAPPDTYPSPVVNAPVALTGFAISFAMDDGAGHEVTRLNLTPRLLAKLLTESYPSSLSMKQHYLTTLPKGGTSTVLQGNPQTMIQDQEFRTLNPGFPDTTPYLDAAATLYSISADSDVMYALTSYIANDAEAKAWLAGAPDPWNMKVNPHYQTTTGEISLPTFSWRLLDPVPDAQQAAVGGCSDFAHIPYLPLVAAAASSLAKISLAVQFASPLSTTTCVDVSGGLPTPIWRFQRGGRQAQGRRFLLGITSLGEASRYQLNTASLQTQVAPGTPTATFSPAGRTFTAPSDASLQAAAKLLVPDESTGTWQIPPDAIPTKPGGAAAYPGTMLLSTQVPTAGLPHTDAGRYAQFLRFAVGEGQTPGTSIGQLPPGYLPMTSANGLGSQAAYTRLAAAAVEAQAGDVPPLVPGDVRPSPSPSGSSSGSTSGSSSGAAGANGALPTSTASAGAGGSAGSPGPFSAVGPNVLGSRTGAAPPPVNAPGDTASGVMGAIGKTLGIISRVAGSILWWLLYIAAGAFAGAGVFWGVARRRGVRLGLRSLIAAIREWLLAVAGRRRAPR